MLQTTIILGLNSWNSILIHLPSSFHPHPFSLPTHQVYSHLTALVIHSKPKSDHVTQLCSKKKFQGLLVSLRVRATVPFSPCRIQQAPLHPCRPHLPLFPLMNSAPVTGPPCFSQHTQASPTTRPIKMMLLHLEHSSSKWQHHAFLPSDLGSNLIYTKQQPSAPIVLYPPSSNVVFCIVFCTLLYFLSVSFLTLSSQQTISSLDSEIFFLLYSFILITVVLRMDVAYSRHSVNTY